MKTSELKRAVNEMVEADLQMAKRAAQAYYNAKNAPFEVSESKIKNHLATYELKLGIAIGVKNALFKAEINNYDETNKLIDRIDEIINIAYNGE